MAGKHSIEVIKAFSKRVRDMNIFDSNLDKVRVISAGNGKCTAELTVEPEHTNMKGTMHGGFSATLVDVISSYALMTNGREEPGVSVDIHMTYMKAVPIGEEVLVEAKTLKAGRTLAYLDVVIKNKKTGQILVAGSHTKFIG